jgi:HEAT repeat protein
MMAIQVLGLRKDKDSADLFAERMQNDPEAVIRRIAAVELARLGDRRGRAALASLLESADNSGRLFLAAQMAEFGDPSGFRHVAEAVDSTNPQTKLLALSALVPFVPFQGQKTPSVVDPVERLLAAARHSDPKIRMEALANFPLAVTKGAPLDVFRTATRQLAVSDPDPELRERARLTLVLWDGEAAVVPEAKKP